MLGTEFHLFRYSAIPYSAFYKFPNYIMNHDTLHKLPIEHVQVALYVFIYSMHKNSKMMILSQLKTTMTPTSYVWGDIERAYLTKHLGKPLDDSCMVCRRCLLEAKRYGQDANHIPSWKTTVADSEPSASSLPPVVIPSVRMLHMKD